jgi:transcription antitermination factor NusG
MAKITLENGMVIEATIEELKAMGVKFPVVDSEQQAVMDDGYRVVTDRKPRVGDFVKFSKPQSYVTVGKYYEIEGIDGHGDPYITDDEGDFFDTYEEDFEVYELVEQVAKDKEVGSTLKVGDYAKVVDDVLEYEKGNIVKIIGDKTNSDARIFDFKVDFINVTGKSKFDGQTHGYINTENITKATDDEVAEALRKLNPLKVGEYAKVVKNEGLLKVGDIVTITDEKPNHYDFFVKRVSDGKKEAFNTSELVKINAEEVAEITGASRWAKIGRKPNEFKKGDVVRVKNPCGAPLIRGQLVEVRQDTNSQYSVLVTDKGWAVSVSGLITPVEHRFDLGGDVE